MSFYEYLRRLYIKELYLILFLSIPLSAFLCLGLENHWLGSAVIIGCIPTLVELYLLNREKNITDYKSLIVPRTIHFISYYLIIMGVSLMYTPFRFEFLLFIPLGISATAFHPFFGKKLTNVLFYFGLASAIGIFLFEFSTENFADPLGIENYTLVGYVFMLTAIFVYHANATNERSKIQHKNDKQDLESQLQELNRLTEERDELTFKLISDFNRTIVDMDADYELIQKLSSDSAIDKISKNGRKNAQLLATFVDHYISGRKAGYGAMQISHVDVNDIIISELNSHYDKLKTKGIELSFEPYTGDLFYSDKEKIKTIVHNLVQNALDFSDISKDSKHLKVKVKAKENLIELSIKDNGIGISENNLRRVFRIFYSTKKESIGTGLYEAKKAADAIGASIRVCSILGEGTSMKTSIPNMHLD